jgi:hypothetical protein
MGNTTELKLVETVNETLVGLIGGDVIKGIIEKQLEATITDIVKESMRSYSDFGKTITEKINQVVGLAASNVELPEYTKFVSTVVLQQFDTVLQAQSKTQLSKLIASELGELPSGIMTARQLSEKIRESFTADEYEDERDIQVELERNDDSSAIYIKVKDDEESEEIKISLYNHRHENSQHYHIGYIESGGWSSRKTSVSERSFNTYCMDKIEQFLFRLYCAQTLIDMSDTSDFEDFSVGGHHY